MYGAFAAMQLKHPLQRIPSPSRGLSALVHVCHPLSPALPGGSLVLPCDPLADIPQALGLASFCWSFKL